MRGYLHSYAHRLKPAHQGGKRSCGFPAGDEGLHTCSNPIWSVLLLLFPFLLQVLHHIMGSLLCCVQSPFPPMTCVSGNWTLLGHARRPALLVTIMCRETHTLAVACNDVGRFVEFHPHGRYIVSDLRGKELVMRLMQHPDAEVQKRALLAVQKIMLPVSEG